VSRLFVPDASVILKWVLPPEEEPNVQEALAILDQSGSRSDGAWNVEDGIVNAIP